MKLVLFFTVFFFSTIPQCRAYTQLSGLCRDFSQIGKTENFDNKCLNSLKTVFFSLDYGPICEELKTQKKNEQACLRTLVKQLGPESFSFHFSTNKVIQAFAPSSTLGRLTIKCIFESAADCLQTRLPNGENFLEIKKISDFVEKPIILDVPLVAKPLSSSLTYDESDKECECIKKEAKKNFPLFDFNSHIESLNRKVNNTIYHQASRNFLNDFATASEDALFFNPSLSEKNDDSLLCDLSLYQEAVDKKCAANGIDGALKSERIESILSSYGNPLRGNNLQEKLTNIHRDVMSINGSVPRKAYDVVRRRSVYEPEYALFQELFIQTSKNSTFKKELYQLIEDGKNPLEAYSSLLASDSDELSKVYEAMVKADTVSPIMQDFRNALKTKKKAKIGEFWGKHLRRMINIQPVARHLFADSELFKKFMSESRNKDVLSFARMNGQAFRKESSTKCQSLMEKFSDLVCVQGNEFKKLASKEDILRVVPDSVAHPDLKEVLLCNHNTSEAPSPFKDLRSGLNEYLQSDFQDRSLNPADKLTNGFSLFASSMYDPKKQETKDFVSRAIASDTEVKFSKKEAAKLSMLDIPESSIKKSESVIAGAPVSETVKKNAQVKTPEVLESPVEEVSAAPVYQAPIAAPVAPVAPVQVPLYSNVQSGAVSPVEHNWKDEFKEFLAQNEDKKEIERLMSGTKDEDLRELRMLKDNLSKSNKDIIESMQKLEQERLTQLEKELRKFDEVKKDKKTLSSKRTYSDDENDFSETSDDYQVRNKSVATPVSLPREINRTSERVSGTSSPDAGVQKLEAKSSGNSIKAIPATSTIRNEESLLVITGGVKTEEPKDVSQELIKFINEKNPDAETLKKIRDSKLRYQYKLSKNGVEEEKELVFEFPSLSEAAKKLLQQKLSEKEHAEVQRTYSVSALKMILFSRMNQ